MDKSREVVITGVGVVCPIGIGKEAYWQSMCEGRSGVGPIGDLAATEMPVQFGGQIGEFNPKVYVKPRKSIKVMCREIQTGFASAAMAVEDAGLDPASVDPDRFGVVLGSQMFYGDIAELEELYQHAVTDGQYHIGRFADRILADLYPLWMLKYLPNMAACHIGIGYDARGPNNTIVQGEASSLLALVECISVIQRGQADVMLTGGTGTRLNLTPLLYRGDSNLSHRGDDPVGASRPFDRNRDGMVNGEGAAAFLLESRAHAESRGAEILCRIPGHGRSYEDPAKRQTGPGNALERAIGTALSESQVGVEDIGHVNAEGVSTVEDDAAEAAIISSVLGQTPVTGLKSYFGNLGGGTGAVEMVASVLSLAEGEIPPTLNYSEPDPNCPINVVYGQPQRTDRGTALVLSRSSTGQVVAAVLQRP